MAINGGGADEKYGEITISDCVSASEEALLLREKQLPFFEFNVFSFQERLPFCSPFNVFGRRNALGSELRPAHSRSVPSRLLS